MMPELNQAPVGPALVVRTPDAELSLSAGRSYFVGRDPQSDIVINDSRVSWRHAVLRTDGAAWLFEDVGSTNGTFQGRDRVQRITISGSCAIRLGHPDDGPAMSLSVAGAAKAADGARVAGPAPTRYVQSPGGGSAPPAHPAVPRLPGEYRAGNGGAGLAGVAVNRP